MRVLYIVDNLKIIAYNQPIPVLGESEKICVLDFFCENTYKKYLKVWNLSAIVAGGEFRPVENIIFTP